MRNKRFPKYPDDTDYNTNSPSYYDDLARKQKLIQLLAEKIWEYENELNETLEQIEQRLTDYILENDLLMTERLENWDHRINEMPEEMRTLFVTWLNDGTLEQIINHDVLGNKADQVDLDKTNERLAQTEQMANVKAFGAIGDFDEEEGTGTDNLQVFKDAIQYAKENNVKIEVPDGNYLVNGYLEIYDSMVGEGVIYFPNNNPNAKLHILSKHSKIDINPYSINGLNEGSTKLEGLNGFTNHTLVIESDEVLIPRYNPPSNNPYYKNEVAMITNNEGSILPALNNNYDKTKIRNMYVIPNEKRLDISISVKGFGSENKNTDLVLCNRSNVNFLRYKSSSKDGTIQTHVNIDKCILIEFYKNEISNAKVSGYGYGIAVGNTAFVFINETHITDTRHAISGRHGKAVTIKGGSFSNDIDSHWGSNYIIDGATIYGNVLYSGKDLTVKNCTAYVPSNFVIIRPDTPELAGKLIVKNNKVQQSQNWVGTYLRFVDFGGTPNGVEYGRRLKHPDLISIEQNDIITDNEIAYLIYGGSVDYQNEPIGKLEVKGNDTPNNNYKYIAFDVKEHLTEFGVNTKIIIEDEEMNADRYNFKYSLIVRDQGETTREDSGVEIEVFRTKSVSSRMADSAFKKITFLNSEFFGAITFESKFEKGQVWIENSTIKDAILDTTLAKFFIINSIFDGDILYSYTNAGLHLNNKAMLGTTGAFLTNPAAPSITNYSRVGVFEPVASDNV